MIYFNNTDYKVYFYGNVILPYSIFEFNTNIEYLNLDKKIKTILNLIFYPIKGDDKSVIDKPERYNFFRIENISCDHSIILNDDIIPIKDFQSKYLNIIFNKKDLVILNDRISTYNEIIDQEKEI